MIVNKRFKIILSGFILGGIFIVEVVIIKEHLPLHTPEVNYAIRVSQLGNLYISGISDTATISTNQQPYS